LGCARSMKEITPSRTSPTDDRHTHREKERAVTTPLPHTPECENHCLESSAVCVVPREKVAIGDMVA
jgi:hypothetical protein